MSTQQTRPTAEDAQRLEVATDWLLRLRDDATSAEDIMQWVEWCESDPRNQQAFERAQAFWRVSGGLAAEVVQGRLRGEGGRLLRLKTGLLSGWLGMRGPLLEHRPAFAVMAMVVAIVAAAAAWNLRGAYVWEDAQDQDMVAAAVAERVRHAQLSDGSRVQLAAKSMVAVQYTERERALELKDGEAYFTVAPNATRPFVVAVGEVRVRAIGTAFNVRRAGERIVVTVTHGTVDVYQAGDSKGGMSSSNGVRVDAGGEVAWDARAAQAPMVASVNPAAALAWREGRLEYTEEPLAAVIADFNRYSKTRAVITDATLEDLRFTGTLLTEVTGEWIHALPYLFAVRVRDNGGVYLIEPLQASATRS